MFYKVALTGRLGLEPAGNIAGLDDAARFLLGAGMETHPRLIAPFSRCRIASLYFEACSNLVGSVSTARAWLRSASLAARVATARSRGSPSENFSPARALSSTSGRHSRSCTASLRLHAALGFQEVERFESERSAAGVDVLSQLVPWQRTFALPGRDVVQRVRAQNRLRATGRIPSVQA